MSHLAALNCLWRDRDVFMTRFAMSIERTLARAKPTTPPSRTATTRRGRP